MKAIAKTTKPIMLIDPVTKEVLEQGAPTLVTWTHFFEARTGAGQIKVLAGDLPDTAEDKDFQEFLRDADNETLAVAAYISMFEAPTIDRDQLVTEAEALELTFRKNISDEKLAEKIDADVAARIEA